MLFLRGQLPRLLIQVSNWNLGLADLARPVGQQAPRILLSTFLVLGFQANTTPVIGFHLSARDVTDGALTPASGLLFIDLFFLEARFLCVALAPLVFTL